MMGFESNHDLRTWVSDKLMSLLGYSEATVVLFVIGLARQVNSPADLLTKLQDFGVSCSTQSTSFAEELFVRVSQKDKECGLRGRVGGGGLSAYQEQEKQAALIARKQRSYSLILDDDDDRDQGGVEERPVKRRAFSDGADCDHDAIKFKKSKKSCDRIEEEALQKNIRRHDAACSQKFEEPKLTKMVGEMVNLNSDSLRANDVDALRALSRQKYLKKRELKKLEEIREHIELLDDGKLSEAEYNKFRYKKEIYELVKKRSEGADDTDAYRMPEAYDQEGCVNQERRFSVALQQYRDPIAVDQVKPYAEQEAWEDCQIRKAALKFCSRSQMQTSDDYQFVFEDQVELVKMDCTSDSFDDKLGTKSLDSYTRNRSLYKRLQEERKSLPIYPYREELLQAVHNHQVIIIVGETGSGKTTQVPQYLHEAGYTRHGKIPCTQPRRIAAMSVAARVSQEMGVKLGHEVGYSIRFEDCTSEKTVLQYMTDGMLLQEFLHDVKLESYSVVMVDEAHERTLSTDVLFGLLKDIAKYRTDLKLLISSATLQAEKFSTFFDFAPILKSPGKRFPVEIYHVKDPSPDYLDTAIQTTLQIHKTEPSGDILVFLPGQEEIETAAETLMRKTKDMGIKMLELIICPIYANLPTELQAKIFEPAPEGTRKVVLATNIAETSLTIDGIKYVIDPGFCKMKSYEPRTEMESLLVVTISKASALQRAGRSGRTGPGKCFRLYTAHDYKYDMDDNTVPEIQRTNLANVVLALKNLGIEDVHDFNFMDPPSSEALRKALELLYALSALDEKGVLTIVGRKMAEFPLDPMLSKMIVASDKYKCSHEIISIAAMLSVGNSIFFRPKGKQAQADNARMSFCQGNVGDHIALLHVYNTWKESNYSSQWCYENFVQFRSMKRARDIRDQLEGLLRRVEIELSSNPNDLDAIKKSIACGFFHRFARLHLDGSYRRLKHPLAVHIHPSSSLALAPPKYVIYHELVLTTKEYMRQVTEIKPQWLLEIAPHYYQQKDVEDLESKKMQRGKGLAQLLP